MTRLEQQKKYESIRNTPTIFSKHDVRYRVTIRLVHVQQKKHDCDLSGQRVFRAQWPSFRSMAEIADPIATAEKHDCDLTEKGYSEHIGRHSEAWRKEASDEPIGTTEEARL